VQEQLILEGNYPHETAEFEIAKEYVNRKPA
jgi:hypothetical protein